MGKIAIVSDSNSGILPEEAERLGIYILPMPFFVNDETFYEGVNLTQEEFYKKLLEGCGISTSMPSVASVTDLWDELLKELGSGAETGLSQAEAEKRLLRYGENRLKEKKKKTFSAQTHFYETVDCLFYPFLSRGDLLFMPFQGDSLPIIAAGVRSACIYPAREDGRRR